MVEVRIHWTEQDGSRHEAVTRYSTEALLDVVVRTMRLCSRVVDRIERI